MIDKILFYKKMARNLFPMYRLKIIKVLPFIFLLFVNTQSCKSPTGPEALQPGRRDYTWTIDTVNSDPYKTLYRIWGSSSSDVWVIGNGDDDSKDIFHFDGHNWIGGGKYWTLYEPNSLYGFGPNDVYFGCASGRIYHFDGNNMKEVAALSEDGHNDIIFDNMWGNSNNDLYAFGAYPDSQGLYNGSVIAKLSNNNWIELNTEGLTGIVGQLCTDGTDQKLYMQVLKISNGYDTAFIYELYQGTFSQLYKTLWGNSWANVSLINNEIYFTLDKKIARRVNEQFQTILDLNNTNFDLNIWGRNSEDIFLEMTDGLAHYNGTDIKYLFHYNQSNVEIFGAALFQDDVFFLVYEHTTGLSLVYHGKLK